VIKCLHPGCTTPTKNFEQAFITAETFAYKHLQRFPHHVVIRYTMNVQQVYRRTDVALPGSPDDVPL
jgi:hypothetical protein